MENNNSALNGDYKNFNSDTSFSQISLWAVLTKNFNYPQFSNSYDIQNSFVRITTRNNKKILAQLYIDTVLSEQKFLKGNIKNDRFVLRRKVKCYGLPFIFLWYSDYKFQITKDHNNCLFIDGINGRATWIFIFSSGMNDEHHFKFQSD
ncbi:MAG: hypothetical protein ABIN97_11015 [Ginsengibacter sp.]